MVLSQRLDMVRFFIFLQGSIGGYFAPLCLKISDSHWLIAWRSRISLQVHFISADTPLQSCSSSLHWFRSFTREPVARNDFQKKFYGTSLNRISSFENTPCENFHAFKNQILTIQNHKTDLKQEFLEKSEYEIVETLVRNDQSTTGPDNRWRWSIRTRPCPNFETKLWSRKRYSHRCKKTK